MITDVKNWRELERVVRKIYHPEVVTISWDSQGHLKSLGIKGNLLTPKQKKIMRNHKE